jgi:hypothetical protein
MSMDSPIFFFTRLSSVPKFNRKRHPGIRARSARDANLVPQRSSEHDQPARTWRDRESSVPIVIEENRFSAPRPFPFLVHKINRRNPGEIFGTIPMLEGDVAIRHPVDIDRPHGELVIGEMLPAESEHDLSNGLLERPGNLYVGYVVAIFYGDLVGITLTSDTRQPLNGRGEHIVVLLGDDIVEDKELLAVYRFYSLLASRAWVSTAPVG